MIIRKDCQHQTASTMLYQSCFSSFSKEIKLKIPLTGLQDANSTNEEHNESAIA